LLSVFFLMIRRPPRSTRKESSAASDVYKRQHQSTRALATKVIAAATDFAPISVWAASTEINQLRMQSYNGATQLWETMLLKFPNSQLKPLTLYRLGWSYRNVSIDGFPRNDIDVLDALTNEYPSSPYTPLAKEMMSLPFKTQNKAAAWSLLPGAGQMYVGDWKLGVLNFSIASGFAAMAVIPAITMVNNKKLDWLGLGMTTVGIIGLQVTYTVSCEDAQRRAIKFNENQEREFEIHHPIAP